MQKTQLTQLLQRLPSPYRSEDAVAPVQTFLAAFEKVLLGGDHAIDADARLEGKLVSGRIADLPAKTPAPYRGLEELIDELWKCFAPIGKDTASRSREDFLPWLAQWVAFEGVSDLLPETARMFVGQLNRLYGIRGSADYLAEILEIYTGMKPKIYTRPDEPLCFHITLDFSALIANQDQASVDRTLQIAHKLIEQQKPAHTRYVLLPLLPSFRVAGMKTRTDAQVGVTTRLGQLQAAN